MRHRLLQRHRRRQPRRRRFRRQGLGLRQGRRRRRRGVLLLLLLREGLHLRDRRLLDDRGLLLRRSRVEWSLEVLSRRELHVGGHFFFLCRLFLPEGGVLLHEDRRRQDDLLWRRRLLLLLREGDERRHLRQLRHQHLVGGGRLILRKHRALLLHAEDHVDDQRHARQRHPDGHRQQVRLLHHCEGQGVHLSQQRVGNVASKIGFSTEASPC
mmetsp:Transcript_16542/g.53862  ORF Transcript_16542/g.53862 Transcript_16542/m.53862 type:complete len:212 (+) Transcript_16542:1578-2213(+)